VDLFSHPFSPRWSGPSCTFQNQQVDILRCQSGIIRFSAERGGAMRLSRGSRAFLLSVVLLGVAALLAQLAVPHSASA
jgi:hypothetical protein